MPRVTLQEYKDIMLKFIITLHGDNISDISITTTRSYIHAECNYNGHETDFKMPKVVLRNFIKWYRVSKRPKQTFKSFMNGIVDNWDRPPDLILLAAIRGCWVSKKEFKKLLAA